MLIYSGYNYQYTKHYIKGLWYLVERIIRTEVHSPLNRKTPSFLENQENTNQLEDQIPGIAKSI